MPEHDEAFYRKHLESIFAKLLKSGWITGWGIHDTSKKYVFECTPKGLERIQWLKMRHPEQVKQIISELDLDVDEMRDLMIILDLHADA
jgi:hypothetical protein